MDGSVRLGRRRFRPLRLPLRLLLPGPGLLVGHAGLLLPGPGSRLPALLLRGGGLLLRRAGRHRLRVAEPGGAAGNRQLLRGPPT